MDNDTNKALRDAWKHQGIESKYGNKYSICLIDLLERVKAIEAGPSAVPLSAKQPEAAHESTNKAAGLVTEVGLTLQAITSSDPSDLWESEARSVIRVIANWVNYAELGVYETDRAIIVNALYDQANAKNG